MMGSEHAKEMDKTGRTYKDGFHLKFLAFILCHKYNQLVHLVH